MADWEEVKRLAADFQKVQLSSTAQRLSERNCVEIISWLVKKKILELIFTSDGKEYLTPAQLVQDIRNELFISGGRINLVELAKIIGVDLAHINNNLGDVLKGHKDIQHILGQLIDSSYIIRIAGEINEKLQQQGQINISDLTIQYDLPADYLQTQVLDKQLNKIIFGQQDKNDPKIYFTESFIARTKAKIRGALAGLTRPTAVASIVNQIDISERLFFSLFDQSSFYGTLTSRLPGAQYIPSVYSRSQSEWVNNFYKQNGYLEFDALLRLGISDYKTYLKKQLPSEEILYLSSCVISKNILERVDADIDECISSKSYVDLQSSLPSVFNEQDIKLILDKVLIAQKLQQTIILNSFVISTAFLDKLSKDCDEIVNEKAKKIVENGKYQQYIIDVQGAQNVKQQGKFDDFEEKVDKREERRKKATGGKSGGGTQGRETKTRSTKKHTRGGASKNEDEYEYESTQEKKTVLEVISIADVQEVIERPLEEEGLDELIEPLTQHLQPKLNDTALEIASNIYATTVADLTANRRQTHNELQNKLNILIGDVRLFEKGIKLIPNVDLQGQLVKYLLKTLCTDIVTEILNYIAAENNSNVQTDNFTNEQRVKFVNDLSAEFKGPLTPLIKSLTGQSIDDFMTTVENGLTACSMILKKIDKKKDRVVILNHKHQLLEELNKCDDLALILHLAVLVIFITATQSMVHASGRHVSALLTFLRQYLTDEQASELTSYHDFVTLMLSNVTEAESAKEKLKEKVSVIKNIANEFKKASASDK